MRRTFAVAVVLAGSALLAGCGGSGSAAQSLQDRQATQACDQVTQAASDTGLTQQVDLRNAEQYAQLAAVDPKYAALPSAISSTLTGLMQSEIGSGPIALDTTADGQCPR